MNGTELILGFTELALQLQGGAAASAADAIQWDRLARVLDGPVNRAQEGVVTDTIGHINVAVANAMGVPYTDREIHEVTRILVKASYANAARAAADQPPRITPAGASLPDEASLLDIHEKWKEINDRYENKKKDNNPDLIMEDLKEIRNIVARTTEILDNRQNPNGYTLSLKDRMYLFDVMANLLESMKKMREQMKGNTPFSTEFRVLAGGSVLGIIGLLSVVVAGLVTTFTLTIVTLVLTFSGFVGSLWASNLGEAHSVRQRIEPAVKYITKEAPRLYNEVATRYTHNRIISTLEDTKELLEGQLERASPEANALGYVFWMSPDKSEGMALVDRYHINKDNNLETTTKVLSFTSPKKKNTHQADPLGGMYVLDGDRNGYIEFNVPYKESTGNVIKPRVGKSMNIALSAYMNMGVQATVVERISSLYNDSTIENYVDDLKQHMNLAGKYHHKFTVATTPEEKISYEINIKTSTTNLVTRALKIEQELAKTMMTRLGNGSKNNIKMMVIMAGEFHRDLVLYLNLAHKMNGFSLQENRAFRNIGLFMSHLDNANHDGPILEDPVVEGHNLVKWVKEDILYPNMDNIERAVDVAIIDNIYQSKPTQAAKDIINKIVLDIFQMNNGEREVGAPVASSSQRRPDSPPRRRPDSPPRRRPDSPPRRRPDSPPRRRPDSPPRRRPDSPPRRRPDSPPRRRPESRVSNALARDDNIDIASAYHDYLMRQRAHLTAAVTRELI